MFKQTKPTRLNKHFAMFIIQSGSLSFYSFYRLKFCDMLVYLTLF